MRPSASRLLAVAALVFLVALPAHAASALVDGILNYRGFTVDMSVVAKAANEEEIETSVKRQLDIAADSGAKPEILAFFRRQKVTLKFGEEDGGGRFTVNGVEVDAVPQAPDRPIILHEFLHALHAGYLPGGVTNDDVLRFYGNAVRGRIYPEDAYILKNVNEFFAVTASVYLWGFVARPPNNRVTLRAKQPSYYGWLGQLFGVAK